ncbi:hypothetical protein HYW60_03095 [Candidatus Kaiserbacteria bacterium]|nr:hypothetical protein [Candidatus Kaiserbacteria bacterium]
MTRLFALRWPLIAFVALALLIEAPLIAFPFYAGEAYQGINIAHFGNDEHYYLMRAREVLDGHSLGQPVLAEGKDNPDSFLYNDEQIIMSPFTLTGTSDWVDVVTYYNILNFIGIFALLFLMYLLVLSLSKNILLSATTAIFVVGGYLLIENGTILSVALRGRDIFYSSFNIFGRSNFPYMALVPFFGFLVLTYRAAISEFKQISSETFRPYLYVAGAGALLGLLFYLYLYAWTFALAFLGALFITALLWRKYHGAVAAVSIGFIGSLIGAYKLLQFYSLYTSEWAPQLSHFFLASESRQFIMSMTGLATLLLFALYAYVRRSDQNNFFLLALILAGWIALEQQLITGRTVQYGHYYWYFVVPISIVVSVYMGLRLIPDALSRWRSLACAALIAAAFVHTGGTQYKSFFTTVEGKLREQDFVPVLARLQELPPAVVLGDPGPETFPFLTTIYTSHDLYWLQGATVSIFPMEHFKEALLIYLYLNKDARGDPTAYLRSSLASTTYNAYTIMYEDIESFEMGIPLSKYRSPLPRTDAEILAAREKFFPILEGAYRELLQSRTALHEVLEARNVRYVLWDRRETPEWDLSVLEPLVVLATSTDITLYLVVSSSNHSLSTTQ